MLSAHHTIKAPGRPITNFVQNQNVLHHFAYQNKRGEILESSYPIIITSPGATGVDFFERFALSSKALLGEVIPLSVIIRPRKLRQSYTFALKKGTSIATRPLVLNIFQEQKLLRYPSSLRSIPSFCAIMVSISQIGLRTAQFILTLLITALVGNVIAEAFAGNESSINYAIFVAVFSWIVLLFGFAAAFVESLAIPMVLIAMDALAVVFTFIAGVVLAAKLHVHSCGNIVSQSSISLKLAFH